MSILDARSRDENGGSYELLRCLLRYHGRSPNKRTTEEDESPPPMFQLPLPVRPRS